MSTNELAHLDPRNFSMYLESNGYASCSRCRLCGTRPADAPPVFGSGDPTQRFVLVGEAPGETEESTGEPFVGRSGRLLEDILFMLGLKRSDVWMTNIVLCRPTDFDNPNKNRAPSQEEIKACKERLHEEIYHIDPLVVVALGSVAAKALGGPSINVTSYRGRWVDIKIPSRDKNRFLTYPMMVTWHPSYVMRKFGTDMEPVSRFLRDHFAKLPTSNQPEHQIVWDLLLAYESALDAYLRERGEPINDSMKELARVIS